MNFLNGYKGQSSGTILVSSFVAIDPTANFTFRQASSAANGATTDPPIGISQPGTVIAPNLVNALNFNNTGAAAAQGVAAFAGQELQIFGPGDICWLTVGTGGGSTPVLAGSFLSVDGGGNGAVVTSGSAQARSFQASSASGDLIQVIVVDHKF